MVAEGTCAGAFGSRLPPLPGKIVPPSSTCVRHDRLLPPAGESLSEPRSRYTAAPSAERKRCNAAGVKGTGTPAAGAAGRAGAAGVGAGSFMASAQSASFMRSTTRPSSGRTARTPWLTTILPCN